MIFPHQRPQLPESWRDVGVLVTKSGFNLGLPQADNIQLAIQHRAALAMHVGAPILWLEQVHGCAVVQPPCPNGVEADASFTTRADYALAVLTADCLPVVLRLGDGGAQNKTMAVAVAHAGWRGLCAGVLAATAHKMAKACTRQQTQDSNSESPAAMLPLAHAEAWLGPAIGPASFEVGQDVYEAFNNPTVFVAGERPGKWLLDIYQAAAMQLRALGCKHILGGGWDTLTDPDWYSHRRATQGGPVGRFATVVRLNGF